MLPIFETRGVPRLRVARGGLHYLWFYVQTRMRLPRLRWGFSPSKRKRTEEALSKAHADLEDHAHNLEAMIAERTAHLQQTITELEAVSYTISHDLRSPLRAMQGFEGTGMGLTIVRKAVHKMNGTIGVRSQVGKGSTFWIELPAPSPRAD